MINIVNRTDDTLLTGDDSADQISNNGKNVTIIAGGGNDDIFNWATNVTVDGGDDDDVFYNDKVAQNVIINAGNGNDSISNSGSITTINGDAGNDTISNWGTNVIIDGGADDDEINIIGPTVTAKGGAGKDTISNWSNNVTINGGADDDIIKDWNGTEVLINGGAGNDSIYINSGTGNTTINTGAGDDTIDVWGSTIGGSRVIQVGSGKNLVKLTNIGSVSVTGSNGAEEIKIYSPVYSNQTSLQSATFTGGKGNDTIYGTKIKDVFNYSEGDGNDVIVNYGGEDTINITNGTISGYKFSGSDVIFNVGSGSITVKDVKDHFINIKDSTGKVTTQFYGNNDYTQQDVIKNFMTALDNTTLTSTEAALDEAVKACSNFNSIQEVIDQFISDCRNVGDADTFLKNYCGIYLDNADTGAITGWDTGGLYYKDEDNAVSESGAASYPTGSSITKRGLTLYLPSGSLTDQQKLVIQGLNSWWIDSAIELIEQSYGFNFYNNANFNTMTLNFYDDSSAFDWTNVSTNWSIYKGKKYDYYSTLNINMAYTSFDEDDMNGGGLDRTLAHEFTHALQYANVDVDLPQFISEGMADLVHGVDDRREENILSLAADPTTLAKYVNLNSTFNGDVNVYSAGYMFLHYFAKQASTQDFVPDTLDATTTGLNYNSDKSILTVNDNFKGQLTADIYDSTVKVIDASSRTNSLAITGNDNGNSIVGSSASDSLNGGNGRDVLRGGKGDDTLIGGADADIFIYNNGDGNDVITDYTDKDIVSIAGSSYYTQSSGDDIILMIGEGSITLKDASDIKLSIIGVRETVSSDLIYNSDKTAVTLAATFEGTLNSTDYDSTIKVIDASNVTQKIGIVGNNLANTIYGASKADVIYSGAGKDSIFGNAGKDSIFGENGADYLDGGVGADTLVGGKGNDTLTGGNGKDVFLYSNGDGNDVITDYSVDDKIKLLSGSISNVSINDIDVILTIGSGSITLNEAVNKQISIVDSNDKTSLMINGSNSKDILNGSSDSESIFGNAGADTIYGYAGADYLSGDNGADLIDGGNGADTIIGGKGKDILTGGKGKNVYIYNNGDGKDTITDYKSTDKIKITGSTYTQSTVGNDVILTVGKGSITLLNAVDKTLNIEAERSYAELFEDDNFNSKLDSILDTKTEIAVDYHFDYAENVNHDNQIAKLTYSQSTKK